MKSCSSIVFALVIVTGLVNIFAPADSQAATIAHWDFEDGTNGDPFSSMPSGGSVDIVNGYIMRGYDATYGPSFSDETPTGVSLGGYCNGSQDGYTTDSSFNAWSPENWTIEISVRLDDVSGWETLIGRDGSTHGDSEADFYLQKASSSGAFRLNYETVTGQRWVLDGDFSVQSGQWYHLAVISDGATLTMYCDKLDGAGYQVVGSLDISSQTLAENALASSGDNWTFGRGWYNGSFVDHVTGYFDNIRFSDSVLTPTEFLGYTPVIITQTDGTTILFTSDTNDTDDYSVVLLEQPSDDVSVTVSPPAGLTVGNGDGQPLDLTFTDQDWNTPQTVTVAIADAGMEPNVINIQHTAQSNDSNYDNPNVPDVRVDIWNDTCGIWGYLESDYNFDCLVDLEDFVTFASLWLETESLIGLQEFSLDWLGTHGNTKYLYSFFQGNGDGLHLAYSDDGLTFTALKNNTTFLTPTIGSNLMRDPSICQGPDGQFHMVWTTGWNDDGIGIAHSPDLINWSAQTYLPSNLSGVDNCWAPEIFYDDATGKYLIFWSSTLIGSGIDGHRIYYITTEDFVTYTTATLFYDPGWSCIDGFIVKDGDRYAMVLKDERNSGKNIRITFSDNAAGPYDVPPSDSITPGGLWVEGPSMVKVGQEWMLYYDAYTSGYMGGQSSTDLANWTDRRGDISFPSGTRHGTVFKVTQDVLDALLAL